MSITGVAKADDNIADKASAALRRHRAREEERDNNRMQDSVDKKKPALGAQAKTTSG